MQHDTTDAARSIKRGGAFRHFASLSEMHIRGTRNDEILAAWPSVNPKADASAQGSGDHQYASDAVARKPAARHGPAQGPSRLDVLGQGGQTTRFHHDGDVPRLASSKLPPARRQTRFSHSSGERVASVLRTHFENE